MKILVTGSDGFIGKNLINHLSKNHTVEGFEYTPNVYPDASKYDWIIHLGAISSTTETNVDKILTQNYEYSMRLLQMCEQMGTNLQYASSAGVYGNTHEFNEESDCHPQSPYAWSKYLFDRFVKLAGEFNVLVQGFRYFNVYGPHEEHKGNQMSPVSKFVQQAKDNNTIKIFNNSEHYQRDFVSVHDVCEVHKQMLDVDKSGIYNVGTGSCTSFKRVAEIIAKKHNANIEEIPMPDSVKQHYQSYTKADNSKVNRLVKIDWSTVEQYVNAQ
jgi:ADP-L-glycero-D-manno-heptose 6-epimerase